MSNTYISEVSSGISEDKIPIIPKQQQERQISARRSNTIFEKTAKKEDHNIARTLNASTIDYDKASEMN